MNCLYCICGTATHQLSLHHWYGTRLTYFLQTYSSIKQFISTFRPIWFKLPFIECSILFTSYSSSSIRFISSMYSSDLSGSRSASYSSSIASTKDVPDNSFVSISSTTDLSVDQISLKSASEILPVKQWPLRLFLAIRMVSIQADRELSPGLGVFPHPLLCDVIPVMFLSNVYNKDTSKSLQDTTAGFGPLGNIMAFCCLLRWHPARSADICFCWALIADLMAGCTYQWYSEEPLYILWLSVDTVACSL